MSTRHGKGIDSGFVPKKRGFTMKCRRMVFLHLSLTAFAVLSPAAIRADEAVERELIAIREELQTLHREVVEQGKMVRTLYELADSQIDFESKKKEKQEDERLRLQPVVEISDPNLTSLSCSSPVSPEIAAITGDGGIRTCDFAGRVTQSLKRRGQIITAVSYSPDGKLLLAGTKDGAILAWRFSAREWTIVAERVADSVGRVAWLGGTRRAVWGAYVNYHGKSGQKLNRDKASGGAIERESNRTAWTYMSLIRDDFQTLSASPNGKKLAVLEIPDKPRGAYILDGSTGHVLATLFHSQHACGPLSVCIAPDNATVAVGYGPRDIILWNAEDEKFLKILEGHSNWVVSLAFSPDVRFLISGAGDSTARIWSVDSGKELGRIQFSDSSTYIKSVGFSPDGKMCFAMAEGKLIVVKTPLGSPHLDNEGKE
jgi:WD40 repeat protein